MQLVDYILRANVTIHPHSQTFPGVFIKDGEYPKGPALRCPCHHEIIAPDVVFMFWP